MVEKVGALLRCCDAFGFTMNKRDIMKDFLSFSFPEEAELLAFGERLAKVFKAYLAEDSAHSLVVYLNGELGAGKTTLTRRIVQSFGHQGNVKAQLIR